MPENRTDRTDQLGLLALMQSPAGGGPASSEQGWGFPYWNQIWLDALLAALHEAARDGVALLTAPATGPTLALSASSGYLPAGLTLEVSQTWVDEWGRETAAGTVSQVSTGAAIENPDTAPTLGTPSAAAAGFAGGLLEVAYSLIDEAAGETLASPVAQVDLPYRSAGLLSEILVTLPATPASVGAAGAYIYARHRSGNWVRAAAITDDSETEATLDGTWISCFVALPLANSTGAGKAIDISGIAAPADAALTRFYVRNQGEAWTSGDRRLRISGVDEWDPSTVSYPLVFQGGVGELAPGYPPPVSQVRAIRKVNLASEVDGVLDESMIDADIARGEDLTDHTGDEDIHFTGTEKADRLLSAEEKSGLTGGLETELHTHPGLGDTPVAGGAPLAQLALSVLRDEEWLIHAHRTLRSMQWREIQTMLSLIEDYANVQPYLEEHKAMIEGFASAYFSADGVVSGLVGSNGGGTTLNYTSGAALVNGTEYLSIGASSLSLTDNATNYVYVGTDGNMAKQTTGWPTTRHAKVCTAVVASGSIGTIDNTVKVAQSAYDGANDQLKGTVAVTSYILNYSTAASMGSSITSTNWKADVFTPGAGTKHLKLKLYIKTLSGQGGGTVRARIVSDSGGSPNKNDVLATATFTDTSGGNETYYWSAEMDLGEITFGAGNYWVMLDATSGTIYIDYNNVAGDYAKTSTDSGASWSNASEYVMQLYYATVGSTTWLSREIELSGEVTRILQSHRRGVSGGSWDDDLYTITVHTRLDAGSWQEIPSDAELVPDPTGDETLEVKVTLTSLSASYYPTLSGLGVIWED